MKISEGILKFIFRPGMVPGYNVSAKLKDSVYRDIENLREAKDAGEDTGPRMMDSRSFGKGDDVYTIRYNVQGHKKIYTEQHAHAMRPQRSSTQIYKTDEQVRAVFERRCARLLRKGYTPVEG